MKDEVEQYGEYKVLNEIGSGGYGQIYVVAKENDQKAYVLKIIKEKKSNDIECLNNEIQMLNELINNLKIHIFLLFMAIK